MAVERSELERDLRSLGRDASLPAADISALVLARLEDAPIPATPGTWVRSASAFVGWLRARWRAVAAVLLGGLIAVGIATPVGATVARWFTFGGVEVEQGPTPSSRPTSAAAWPSSVPSSTASAATGGALTVTDAAALVGFTPLVPATLGAPDSITVSADHRLLTMMWRGSGIHLDQFLGAPSPIFIKKSAQEVDYVTVGTDQALWFPGPHELVYIDRQGRERMERARTAGRTLLWTHGPLTLRLEGAGTRDRAVGIASSVG